MKLYYAPGACSLASHIALEESGLKYSVEEVDLHKKLTRSGKDFRKINLKGYVPALEIEGDVLSESLAILMYVGDQRPDTKLTPRLGTMQRYRVEEWLAFLTTEIHKSYLPLFTPQSTEEAKSRARDRLNVRYAFIDQHLLIKAYLVGETFTVADAYLYVMEQWAPNKGISLGSHLRAHFERVGARPAVRAVLQAEGLTVAKVA